VLFRSGCIVKTRTIGALIVEDEKGEDAKILSIPVSDARFDGYRDITDVHPHQLKEIKEFFETYKRLEPLKWVKFKEWRNASDSFNIVRACMKTYDEKIKRKPRT
jgi:inorganic pyrophosphatase